MAITTYCLHHHPLDPPSRRVRLAMGEKALTYDTIIEKPWEPREEYLELNPAGEVPTLVITTDDEEVILGDATAICEFLEETHVGTNLIGKDPVARAEVRRLINWFEHKTYQEVTLLLVGEKAFKKLRGEGQPDSAMIRAGYHNIHGHLDYIGWLAGQRNWLAGDQITLADLAAAAQISAVDYIGDVPWQQHPEAKEWYARIKSRPSFRPLLGDHIPGFLPPETYADLDF
jgi:glutathione S-transferase